MRSKLLLATLAVLALLAPHRCRADTNEDQAAASRIAKELKQSGKLHDYKIGVKVRDDTVWLMGKVTDASQAQAAVEIARGHAPSQRVISELAIGREEADLNKGLPPAPRQRAGTVLASRAVSQAPQVPSMAQSRPQQLPAQPVAAMNQVRRPAALGAPLPAYVPSGTGVNRAVYDQPHMPGYAWPSYAAYPNYAALTYPKQYSPAAWPYIGPFYPYPQVPLGWRKVTLEWDDGWWNLDFKE